MIGIWRLNEAGDLEIHKVFNCSIGSPKAAIFARANHPTLGGAAGIVQKSLKDLKAIIKSGGLEASCNLTSNPSMRAAIYAAQGELGLQSTDVLLNEDNAKAIWGALQQYMPIFALFQSDRPNSDQDPEVQNPMKVAIEQALDQLEQELDNISEQVRAKAQETADRTLAKLQASYPNLASTLQPKFKKPAWKSIFKLDLEADDGIPLNKRGSGVRLQKTRSTHLFVRLHRQRSSIYRKYWNSEQGRSKKNRGKGQAPGKSGNRLRTCSW